jgi:hypothetical protein
MVDAQMKRLAELQGKMLAMMERTASVVNSAAAFQPIVTTQNVADLVGRGVGQGNVKLEGGDSHGGAPQIGYISISKKERKNQRKREMYQQRKEAEEMQDYKLENMRRSCEKLTSTLHQSVQKLERNTAKKKRVKSDPDQPLPTPVSRVSKCKVKNIQLTSILEL